MSIHKVRRFLAMAPWVLAVFGSLSASAQFRIENGVVIAPILKGPLLFRIPGLAGPLPKVDKICASNSPCVTMVVVFIGGLDLTDPDQPKWDPLGCSAYWPYNAIRVGRGLQPVLRWVLIKDPGDPATYAFQPYYGIRLTGNDINHDLYKPTINQDGTVFEWYDLHFTPPGQDPTKPRTVSFVPNVWRVENGQLAKLCTAADPDVINEN